MRNWVRPPKRNYCSPLHKKWTSRQQVHQKPREIWINLLTLKDHRQRAVNMVTTAEFNEDRDRRIWWLSAATWSQRLGLLYSPNFLQQNPLLMILRLLLGVIGGAKDFRAVIIRKVFFPGTFISTWLWPCPSNRLLNKVVRARYNKKKNVLFAGRSNCCRCC